MPWSSYSHSCHADLCYRELIMCLAHSIRCQSCLLVFVCTKFTHKYTHIHIVHLLRESYVTTTHDKLGQECIIHLSGPHPTQWFQRLLRGLHAGIIFQRDTCADNSTGLSRKTTELPFDCLSTYIILLRSDSPELDLPIPSAKSEGAAGRDVSRGDS